MRKFTIAVIMITTCLPVGVALAQLGETYTVGRTWFETQHTTSVGKTIAADEEGGYHFCWTRGYNPGNDPRHVYYNFYDRTIRQAIEDQFDNNAVAIESDNRSGYVSLDLFDSQGTELAMCFYHIFGRAAMSMDFDRGLGAFEQFLFDAPNRWIPLELKGTVDANGRAHIVGGAHDMQNPTFPLVIWHAEFNEREASWEFQGEPRVIEVTTGLSHCIKAATESERVALVWHHSILGNPAPEDWEGTQEHNINNDLYLYESPDGEEWDYDNSTNITETIPADRDLDAPAAYGDTLRPFNDCDVIYEGETAHVVFTTRGFWIDLLEQAVPPVERFTLNESLVWHWDSDSDTLTLVANGWYETRANPGPLYQNVSRPSLGLGEDGTLYCVFRQVTDQDIDAEGYCFGELMLSISRDQGITWSEPINLTATTDEDEDESEYVDEQFPSLAEVVDRELHLFYHLASDDDGDEAGDYEMVYRRIPVDDLPEVDDLPLPREGFQYHNRGEEQSVRLPGGRLPESFAIESVFPNPFNSRVAVRYTAPPIPGIVARVTDLSGRIVERRMLPEGAAGFAFSLDATDWTTGIYIVRLTAAGVTVSRKIVCLK